MELGKHTFKVNIESKIFKYFPALLLPSFSRGDLFSDRVKIRLNQSLGKDM